VRETSTLSKVNNIIFQSFQGGFLLAFDIYHCFILPLIRRKTERMPEPEKVRDKERAKELMSLEILEFCVVLRPPRALGSV